MTRNLLLAVAACALATSCAAAGTPETSDTPRRDLAERPTPLSAPTSAPASLRTSTPGSSATGAPATSRPAVPTESTGGGRAGDGGSTDPSATQPAPFRTIASMTDLKNDAGLDAPTYADLRQITLADNGRSLKVTVTLGGTLPARTADDETMGIGVDLYPPGSGRESDYQVFADGETDGWFAYLDSPDGFVRYPGTFGLGGNRLVFTVPWESVGNPRIGRFSGFVDWTRRAGGVTGNKASNDYAPAIGTKTYAR